MPRLRRSSSRTGHRLRPTSRLPSRRNLATALITTSLLAVVACTQGTTSIGPLTLDVPDGWQVSDRGSTSIKLTNGTIADENSIRPGTATAVFDVYVDSPQTVDEFRDVLREHHVQPSEDHRRVDGYGAVILAYGASAFGPPTEVVFVPAWRVQIIYRAAFSEDRSAFLGERPAFRRALRSIRFSGLPASSPRA